MILIRTATTTEEPDRGDQTAGLQDHHQNRRECTSSTQTSSETPPPEPNHSGPVRQRYGEKEHKRPRQTTEVDKRPTELKPSPILTGRNEQNRSTHHYRHQHNRHGDRPCYRQANDERFIGDDNGKVFKNLTSFPKTEEENNFENSELDLASNLSSSAEIEADIKHEEEKTVRRSKRLTKTNPIV